jgi:signal transduction histidine kinase
MSAVTLTVFKLTNRKSPGLEYWALSSSLYALGFFLMSGRDYFHSIISIGTGNSLIFIGYAFHYYGMRTFSSMPTHRAGLAFLVLMACTPYFVLHADAAALPVRIMLADSITATAFLMIAQASWQAQRFAPIASRLSAGLFAAQAMVAVARAVATYNNPPIGSLMDAGIVTALFYCFNIVLCFGYTVFLTLMVSERLRRDLEQANIQIAIARDRAEEALAEQRNFLSMVSHEFRTPLATIGLSAELLSGRPCADKKNTEQEAKSIRRQVRRLTGLVDTFIADDWLDVAINRDRRTAADMAAMLTAVAKEHEVPALFLDVPQGTSVQCDTFVLPFAISNLLENAKKYGRTPKGAALAARLTSNKRRIVIEVSDDGGNLLPTEADRIFEKFFRGSQAQKKPGAGLGLYLVKRIVAAHGGTIEVDVIPYEKTVFRVYLPCAIE